LVTLVHVDTKDGDITRSLRYYPNKTNFPGLTTDALILFLRSLQD